MTQRRRMSRADVERTPLRTVMPGVSARGRWGESEEQRFYGALSAFREQQRRAGRRPAMGEYANVVQHVIAKGISDRAEMLGEPPSLDGWLLFEGPG